MKSISTGDKIAALGEELSAIHFTKVLYWKRGADNSREARAKYQFRQDRVDEIRKEFTQLLTVRYRLPCCTRNAAGIISTVIG